MCEDDFHRSTPEGQEVYDRMRTKRFMVNMAVIDAMGQEVHSAPPVANPARTRPWPEVREEGRRVREEGLRQREGDQPLPVGNDLPVMHDLVIEDLRKRLEVGIKRYGQPLQPFNGRNALRDAYEEVLDLTVYLRQALWEAERGSQTHPEEDER